MSFCSKHFFNVGAINCSKAATHVQPCDPWRPRRGHVHPRRRPQIEKIIDQQPWTPSPPWRRLLEENVRALETVIFFTKVQTRQDDWVSS